MTNVDEVRQRQRLEWRVAASGWRKWDGVVMKTLQQVSDLLIKSAEINPGDFVLDVATGTGEPALTISKLVGPRGRVVGVDLSPDMLDVARERAASQGISNVTFQVNEDEDLSAFPDSTFDAVVCRLGLMFMPEPVRALKGFLRVLKPNRRASVSTWASSPSTAIMKAVVKHVPDFQPAPPGTPGTQLGIPSPDMLGDIFTRAGFSNYNYQTTAATLQSDSAEECWEMISETGGPLILLLSKLSAEKRQAIKDDVIETLRHLFPVGPIKLTGELIVGTGTRG